MKFANFRGLALRRLPVFCGAVALLAACDIEETGAVEPYGEQVYDADTEKLSQAAQMLRQLEFKFRPKVTKLAYVDLQEYLYGKPDDSAAQSGNTDDKAQLTSRYRSDLSRYVWYAPGLLNRGETFRIKPEFEKPTDTNPDKEVQEKTVAAIAGMYSTSRKEIMIITDYLGHNRDSILVHEMTHALQDQYFNLSVFREPLKGNLDVELSSISIPEGDATFSQALHQSYYGSELETRTACLENSECPRGAAVSGPACTNDVDCPGEAFQCAGGACTLACEKNSECGEGLRCGDTGVCVRTFVCDSSNMCAMRCLNDAECGAGLVCGQSGSCVTARAPDIAAWYAGLLAEKDLFVSSSRNPYDVATYERMHLAPINGYKLVFPYTVGLQYVFSLFEPERNHDGVNMLFVDPPTRARDFMFGQTHDGDVSAPDPGKVLTSLGYTQYYKNSLGAYLLFGLLMRGDNDEEAADFVADSYRAYIDRENFDSGSFEQLESAALTPADFGVVWTFTTKTIADAKNLYNKLTEALPGVMAERGVVRAQDEVDAGRRSRWARPFDAAWVLDFAGPPAGDEWDNTKPLATLLPGLVARKATNVYYFANFKTAAIEALIEAATGENVAGASNAAVREVLPRASTRVVDGDPPNDPLVDRAMRHELWRALLHQPATRDAALGRPPLCGTMLAEQPELLREMLPRQRP